MCPSSCTATDQKSVCDGDATPPNDQLAAESNHKLPPHGPKSVGVESSAPVWPRASTVSSQSLSPAAETPPGALTANSPDNDRPPTKTSRVSAGILRLERLAGSVAPGSARIASHVLVPDGAIAVSESLNREKTLAACCSVSLAPGVSKK